MPDIATAAAVANKFLDLQQADAAILPPIDPMKLQKLLFYGHGWSLAMRGEPLFAEEVYAWPWGPVVPDIYGMFKDFGRNPIVGRRASGMVRVAPGAAGFQVGYPALEDGPTSEFVKSVWESHKRFSGIQLSNATHAKGEPWTIVMEQYGSLAARPLIPNSLIQDVFKGKLQPAA